MAWKTDWDASRETAYVHWWYHADGTIPSVQRDFETRDDAPFLDPWRDANRQILRHRDEIKAKSSNAEKVKKLVEKFQGGSRVPLPKDCVNPNWPKDEDDWETTPDEVVARLPTLPDDTVIVGVIDTGVALGHRAFRFSEGASRVIASWQQTARFEHQGQRYLPFGEEWYAGDIDRALQAYSRNPGSDRLDEDGFNRALHLVEPTRVRGHRDLDHRAAHGTHIMDMAAGYDPSLDRRAERVRMIVVNLPTQYLHGYAGNFLEFFAAYAILRVFDLADALWRKAHPGVPGGYPVALNLAYGMMAGPKDGTRLLETVMDLFVADREGRGLPTSICLPAGNENLARAVARVRTGPEAFHTPIPYRTLSSDGTSNHIEFWFTSDAGSLHDKLDRFVFEVTAPTGELFTITGTGHSQYHDLAGVAARLYCRLHPDARNPASVHFMFATAPTLLTERMPTPVRSPAGLWTFRVTTPIPARLSAYVQSDQSARVQSTVAQRSYFDHCGYQTHLPSGRIRDTYSYMPGGKATPDLLEPAEALVSRRGSVNALATTRSNSALTGFRRSDGRPADYSATELSPDVPVQRDIQAAYPTDDSAALYGVLAAGARDGSSVAYRGTSMAAAQATRRASHAMLDWIDKGKPLAGRPGDALWHATLIGTGALPTWYGSAAREKIGSGRIYAPEGHRRGRASRR